MCSVKRNFRKYVRKQKCVINKDKTTKEYVVTFVRPGLETVVSRHKRRRIAIRQAYEALVVFLDELYNKGETL